ncbi:hypothetical protein KBI5_21490 [Frankia sp. KB5]|nr:hypothetical protein KBI5_21490 [Frankia sp. KB5]
MTTVWPAGGHSAADQTDVGRRLTNTESSTETCAVLPAVAAHAIAVYSQPGDTICDPDCGPGTAVVEAIHAHRHAIGIAHHQHDWQTARAAVTAAKVRGATADGMILDAPPDPWSWTGLGPIDLVLTLIRPIGDSHGTSGAIPDWMRARLSAYADLPRPGGHVVVVTPYHLAGGVDLATTVAAAGREIGLRPVQRAVALTSTPSSPLTGHRRTTRDSIQQTHQDVIIFVAAGRGRLPGPPARPPHPSASATPHGAGTADLPATSITTGRVHPRSVLVPARLPFGWSTRV